MEHKKRGKKWTYSGIQAHYPGLTFADWLSICKSGDHCYSEPRAVVYELIQKGMLKNFKTS
jgi:hypothetical protein